MKKNFLKKEMYLVLVLLVLGGVSNVQSTPLPAPKITGPSNPPALPLAFKAFDPSNFTSNMVPDSMAPEIAEWTRINAPGDTMALTGERLSVFSGSEEGRDTHFAFFGQGVEPRDSLIQLQDDKQVAVTLPKSLPSDEMYLMWPRNANGYGYPVAINKAEAWWVGPDKASAGETFSVFGRNLKLGTMNSYLYIEGYGWLTSVSANPYKADFIVPNDLGDGSYTVYAHNGHGGTYGWAEKQTLLIQDHEQDWSNGTTHNVKQAPYNAKGDGVADDHSAIVEALNAADPGDTIYLPAGTYLVTGDFDGKLNDLRLLGDGMDATTIGIHPSSSNDHFVQGTVQNARFEGLTFDTKGNGSSSDFSMFNALGVNTRNLIFEGVRFNYADELTYRGGDPIEANGSQYLTIRNCEFITPGAILFKDPSCRQLFIDGCDFYGMYDAVNLVKSFAREMCVINSSFQNLDNSNAMEGYGWSRGRAITGSGNHDPSGPPMRWYFGDNTTIDMCPRDAAPRVSQSVVAVGSYTVTFPDLSAVSGFDPDDLRLVILSGDLAGKREKIASIDIATGVVTIQRSWAGAYGQDPAVGDVVALRDQVDMNAGEAFMVEACFPRYRGTPSSSTSSTTTFPDLSTDYTRYSAFIVAGRGLGQVREIVDYSSGKITLDTPWNVQPDGSSVIIIGSGSRQIVAYNNQFDGTAKSIDPDLDTASAGVEPYGMANDWIVDGNTFNSLRQGIAEFPQFGDIGSTPTITPMYFNYYANNVMTDCYSAIERSLVLNSGESGYSLNPIVVGSVFRKNTILDSKMAAFDHSIASWRKTDDLVYLSVMDGNTANNNNKLHEPRAGFFNQVWVNNKFNSSNGGQGLIFTGDKSTMVKGNDWSGFSSPYGGALPGPILSAPVRLVSLSDDAPAFDVPVFNSGTDELNWQASTDSTWLNISQSGSTVADENSTGTLQVELDDTAIPAVGEEAIITIQADNDQAQQLTVIYEGELSPPPPDGPPDPVLIGISISGPSLVDEETTAQYTCTANWSDGTTTTIAPTWSENSAYASIDSSGLLTARDVDADQNVTITASYGGETDTHTVIINYIAPVLEGITISGPTSVDEEQTAQYSCTASWSDGTTTAINPTWSENSSFASINASGVLSAGNVSSDQNVTVTASYSGLSDTHTVTIQYVAPVITAITIAGPTSVDEEQTAQYSCAASWSDGTTTAVNPTWSENSASATISSGGLLTARDVDADVNVTITASYGGLSDTHTVTIQYVAPVITAITIAGPTSVDEGQTAQYSCTASWSDGTTTTVNPTWSENSASATISSGGLLTARDVDADVNVTITASYDGRSDSHTVTINYIAPVLEGITISGPTSVNEEETAQYSCTANWSDGTTSTVTPAWGENSSYASIGSGGLLTAGDVASDQTITITASYSGESDTHTVTILYIPPPVVLTGISITGPAELEENTTGSFICTAYYSDGTSSPVTPTWSENAAFASIDASGSLTVANIEEDASVTVTASYQGETDSQSVDVWMVGTRVVYPLTGFEGKLIRGRLWDAVTETYTYLGEMVNPDELVIENVNSNQWYWIIVEEYDEAATDWIRVQANWINM